MSLTSYYKNLRDNSLEYMCSTYNSYGEYKFNYKQAEIKYLIHRKYLKLLGELIETLYPGLKFDIFIRDRNPKERKLDWYGMTYMELVIFDILGSPVYNPMNFEPSYRTPHFDGYISGEILFNDIDSYMPDINKHLLISFRPLMHPHEHNTISQFYVNLPDFECWRQYYLMEAKNRDNREYF